MKKLAVIFILAILAMLPSCTGTVPTRITGFAMDTEISVTVYGDTNLASEVLHAVTALENEISWSIDGSAVYRLNQSGEAESRTLCDIIAAANELYRDTDGRYSIAVRELCNLWDINSGEQKIPSDADIAAVLRRTGSMPTVSGDKVTLSGGQAVDLGSLGKGAACDKAAELFKIRNQSGIAAIGSSLALCANKPDGEKWTVAVASPDDKNKSVGVLYLDGDCFVSTSNGAERGFTLNGKRYHHIIDAVTGYPSQSDVKSVAVIAKSGVMSDALSTACFIVGYDESVKLLGKYDAKAVFVLQNGQTKCFGDLEFEVAK